MCVHTHKTVLWRHACPLSRGGSFPRVHRNSLYVLHATAVGPCAFYLLHSPVPVAPVKTHRTQVFVDKSHPRRRVPPPQAECHCSCDVCVLCWRAQIRRLRRRCWNRRTAAIAHAFARARALALRSRWQVGANTPAPRTTVGRCCFLAIYIAGTEFCW